MYAITREFWPQNNNHEVSEAILVVSMVMEYCHNTIYSFLSLYFQMCVRQYPIVAKFGIMHLIATNICIYILSTFTEIKNNITHSSGRMVSLQGNSNYTYYQSSDTGIYYIGKYHIGENVS